MLHIYRKKLHVLQIGKEKEEKIKRKRPSVARSPDHNDKVKSKKLFFEGFKPNRTPKHETKSD